VKARGILSATFGTDSMRAESRIRKGKTIAMAATDWTLEMRWTAGRQELQTSGSNAEYTGDGME
jgi:hypothetical protein